MKDVDKKLALAKIQEGANIESLSQCILNPKHDQTQYGAKSFLGRNRRLHRVIYWLGSDLVSFSDLTSTTLVRHKCRNKQCLNPEHYETGTYKDNAKDRQRDGTQLRGEYHHNTKITLETAQQIADSWRPNGTTQKQRAQIFGVNARLIQSIDARLSWEDVVHPNGKAYKPTRAYSDLRNNAKSRVLTIAEYETVKRKLQEKSQSQQMKENMTECWLWKAEYKTSYPNLSIFGFTQQAHVYACEVSTGRRNQNEVARHMCGISRCVNPDHLRPGTHKENSDDRKLHGTNRKLITDDDVADIRSRVASSDQKSVLRKQLAAEYQISLGWIQKLTRDPDTKKYKLTDMQVQEIRESGLTARELTMQYDVSIGYIRLLIRDPNTRKV